MQESILALDPGESTGWCWLNIYDQMKAGTLPKNHESVLRLIQEFQPDRVVYESFNLYPGKAQKMVWNSFYPCEVIGVIKVVCQIRGISITAQAPPVKKFVGPLPQKYIDLSRTEKLTEHSKDACQHLCYYLRQIKQIDRVK